MGGRSDMAVLRSINLPAELDEGLRTVAFVLRRPKADLMRYFISTGLAQLTQRMGSKPSEETLRDLARKVEEHGSLAFDSKGIESSLTRLESTLASRRR